MQCLKSCQNKSTLKLPSFHQQQLLLIGCKSLDMTKEHLQWLSYLKSSFYVPSLPSHSCGFFCDGKEMTTLVCFMPSRKLLKKKLVCFVGCFTIKRNNVILSSSLFNHRVLSLSNICFIKSKSSWFFQRSNIRSTIIFKMHKVLLSNACQEFKLKRFQYSTLPTTFILLSYFN